MTIRSTSPWAAGLVFALGALGGCGGDDADPSTTDAGSAATVDAGRHDGGTPPDAGTIPATDAGHAVGGDAGHGGVDAGRGADAGHVSATDAGPFDAGALGARLPADVLDLLHWKLTLPINTSHPGNPDEYEQPELATFSLAPYFVASDTGGVVFHAHAGGATTSGSGYPRSELREMTGADGSSLASWSTSSGTHTMIIREAITHLPVVKPHVVAGQIHDAADDVVMIRLEGSRLFVEGGGDDLGTLDDAYTLGDVFTVRIVASGGHIRVFYDDVMRVDVTRAAVGCYFKAGCYTQSNTSRGDAADAFGEVVIYDLQVTHE